MCNVCGALIKFSVLWKQTGGSAGLVLRVGVVRAGLLEEVTQ